MTRFLQFYRYCFILMAGAVMLAEPDGWLIASAEKPVAPVAGAQPLFAEPANDQATSCQGIPHTAYGVLVFPTGITPASVNLKLKAYIISRPEEIQTEGTVGAGMDSIYWWLGVGNFPTQWKIGDTLYVEIEAEDAGFEGEDSLVMTSAGSDCGGDMILTWETGVQNHPSAALPAAFDLMQNHPNPFNSITVIQYNLPQANRITLAVFDMLGRRLTTLVDGVQPAGCHTVRWDGRDDFDRPVSSGVYWCLLTWPESTQAIKMVMLR